MFCSSESLTVRELKHAYRRHHHRSDCTLPQAKATQKWSSRHIVTQVIVRLYLVQRCEGFVAAATFLAQDGG